MESGIYTLLGVLIGGFITWVIQYFFRHEERKWEIKNDKKKVAIESLDILYEILEVYDTFPVIKEDDSYFKKLNEKVRNSKVKLKILFGNDNIKIVENFEEANRSLKSFVTMQKGERIKISKNARDKIKKFENLIVDFFCAKKYTFRSPRISQSKISENSRKTAKDKLKTIGQSATLRDIVSPVDDK